MIKNSKSQMFGTSPARDSDNSSNSSPTRIEHAKISKRNSNLSSAEASPVKNLLRIH